ncbi:MAG: hypothetical protein PVG65_03375 [Candidatus Thorarchaeota archaeon]|jgi:hypothetical protein
MSWKDDLNEDSTSWLLQGPPWVRYNTLLLENNIHSEIVEKSKNQLLSHPLIQEIIKELISWPGYPLKRHNDAHHAIHKLVLLADLGITCKDPGISEIANKICIHQLKEGPFQIDMLIPTHFGGSGKAEKLWMACDFPSIVYALTTMGFSDEHLKSALEFLPSLMSDKGVLCTGKNPRFRGPGKKDDPCPLATLLTTKALIKSSPKSSSYVKKGANMLLWHWSHQKERKLYLFGIGTDYRKLKFPYIWYDILHVLDVLSQIESLKKDHRIHEMMNSVLSKQDSQGRFTPESVWMAFKKWDFGQKRTPSPWITFLIMRILKRLYG